MLKASTRWLRFFLALCLVVLFAWQAWLLFRKQQEKFSFHSFRIQNETGFIVIPNVDKLKNRVYSVEELNLSGLPETLEKGLNAAIANKEFRWEESLTRSAAVSWNDKDFAVIFKTGSSSASQLADILQASFQTPAILTNSGLQIDAKEYFVESYHNYLVVSTQTTHPKPVKVTDDYGNADFVLFNSGDFQGERHILVNGFHHLIRRDSSAGPAGEPLYQEQFLKFAPASFSSIEFYGSRYFSKDRVVFFGADQSDEFSWVDQGFIYLKKDSFELLIAPQNVERDLRLTLEEQTLNQIGDTNSIHYFNIGPYEIMPFQSNLNWKDRVEGMSSDPAYFTILENYNVLANSIPAMRWYLGEIQLGNLFLKNPTLTELYRSMIPQRAHFFQMKRESDRSYSCSSAIWVDGKHCIRTVSQTMENSSVSGSGSVDMVADFEISILPDYVQMVNLRDTLAVLASNSKEMALYKLTGEQIWRLNYNSVLTGKPQVADFEQDGTEEIVLFMQNQVDVIKSNGLSATGFPAKLNATSKGGLAVNYDESYNYRLLVNLGNQVRSMDESGQFVQGWTFTSMTSELQGEIAYFVTGGKDMISFKDINNRQYVLNRRGESRLTKEVTVSLPNESAFVVGNFDTGSLRKLGYRNGNILNYYLLDGHIDSVKLDRPVEAVSARWIFNDNKPLLVIEESGRVVVIDEFGYETQSVLKPITNQFFAGLVINEGFEYVFADNSQNALYLLNGLGKMIFPVPVAGTPVFELKNNLLCTFVGTKIKIYKTD